MSISYISFISPVLQYFGYFFYFFSRKLCSIILISKSKSFLLFGLEIPFGRGKVGMMRKKYVSECLQMFRLRRNYLGICSRGRDLLPSFHGSRQWQLRFTISLVKCLSAIVTEATGKGVCSIRYAPLNKTFNMKRSIPLQKQSLQ